MFVICKYENNQYVKLESFDSREDAVKSFDKYGIEKIYVMPVDTYDFISK